MICATSRRSANGMLASPKYLSLKVRDQTTVEATTKPAAAENTGRQRTAIHSKTGNTKATSNAVGHGRSGSEATNALNAPNMATPSAPSTNSRREGELRTVSAIPTSSGATVTMPRRQDANQNRHTAKGDPVDSITLTAHVAAIAAAAAPNVAATRKPSTCDTSASSSDLPNQRSMSPVVSSA